MKSNQTKVGHIFIWRSLKEEHYLFYKWVKYTNNKEKPSIVTGFIQELMTVDP